MQHQVVIDGIPVLDIWECANTRCWFVTRKVMKRGQCFLSGYVRCFKPCMLAEFEHLPEEVFTDMEDRICRVPKEAWHRCPCVDIIPQHAQRTVVRCSSPDTNALSGQSYSNNCKGVNEKMDYEIQDKLDRYLDVLDDIKERTDDNETAKVILGEIAKDLRMREIQQARSLNGNSPATVAQVNYLKRLGAVIPEGLTRKQASVLIDETKAARGQSQGVAEVPMRVP